MIWNWLPNTCYGPFYFGRTIEEYLNIYQLVLDSDNSGNSEWTQYGVPDTEIYISVEDRLVVSIMSFGEFNYKGKNIIGLNKQELDALLEGKKGKIGESVEYEDGDIQTCFEYSEMGLQVWISDNLVVSTSCCDSKD